MVNFEWDEELARQVRAEEAWEDGVESGMQQGMQQCMQQALAASIGNLMKSMNSHVRYVPRRHGKMAWRVACSRACSRHLPPPSAI